MTPGSQRFGELARELARRFARGVDTPWSEADWAGLALEAFAWQVEANPTYAAFASTRGADPASLDDWRRIPPVPATAFKHLALVSGDPGAVERVFRTSGTTGGPGFRGEHHVLSLDLYRASALPAFGARLVPEGRPLPILSLIPDPGLQPWSSLSTMVGFAMEAFGAGGSGWFARPDTGVDAAGFRAAAGRAADRGDPVLVVGTAFAFVHWLDAAAREGWRVTLPEGSRLMETGGFKGRSREISRDELYRGLTDRLGVPSARIVNEYGMTELLSQFYEPVLARGEAARGRHVAPPWLRTRVLDPETLDELPAGEAGLLCHYDLANLGSVLAVLTEDRGRSVGGGVELLGRAPGAEPRGCSLALEALLETAEG